mgnify:CR=1 FL=1
MLGSWHNFIFNAFDPAGFISIDKPPVAIWLQVASAKLLGFSALAILLAQVMAGLAAILLVYVLVRKYWGGTAGAIAALSLALSPVNVAVDRSNNTESCLILVLLAGVWLAMRAAETGRLALLCAAMAAIGIGFNVKMGAALVLAPVLALTFSLARPGAPVTWHLGRQAIAGLVLVAVSLSWAIFFDPHAGSRSALMRAAPNTTPCWSLHWCIMAWPASLRYQRPPADQTTPASTEVRQPRYDRRLADGPSPPVSGRGPRHSLPGCCRSRSPALFSPGRMHGVQARSCHAASAPACGPAGSVMYWIVLSFAGGLIHTYYVAVLGPPLAVFSGIAVAGLWSRWKAGKPGRICLPLIIVATAAWQFYLCMAPSGQRSDPIGSA